MRGTPSGSCSFLFQSLSTWGVGGIHAFQTDSITRVETSPGQPQERLSYFLQVIWGWAGCWWWEKASFPESVLSGEDCFSDWHSFCICPLSSCLPLAGSVLSSPRDIGRSRAWRKGAASRGARQNPWGTDPALPSICTPQWLS